MQLENKHVNTKLASTLVVARLTNARRLEWVKSIVGGLGFWVGYSLTSR